MFENILPVNEEQELVALPMGLIPGLYNVYGACDIEEKYHIYISPRTYGGRRGTREPKMREKYYPTQRIWYNKFVERFPDFELPKPWFPGPFDEADLFKCFYTNIPEDKLWILVERVIKWDKSDIEIMWTDYCQHGRKSYAANFTNLNYEEAIKKR